MTTDEIYNAIFGGGRNVPDTKIRGNIYGFGPEGNQSRSPTYWRLSRDLGWIPYAQPPEGFYPPPARPGPQFNPRPLPIFEEEESGLPARQRFYDPTLNDEDLHLLAALRPLLPRAMA